ncbi:hypothetical protein GCM10027059_43370 [Myceligenerans halotolerans]
MKDTAHTMENRVTASYRDRVELARAETRPVVPRLLAAALDGAAEVLEFPCGTGHFLTAYAQAGVRVRLIDGSAPMLGEAVRHARRSGVGELAIGHHLLHHLPAIATADVVVVPNGAINQLAAQDDLVTALALIRAAMPARCRLVLQALTTTTVGTPFYDPGLADEEWHHDRVLSAPDFSTVHRYRRQRHRPGRVAIEFAYTRNPRGSGRPEHTAKVELTLPTPDQFRAAAGTAGWQQTDTATHEGFTELLARAGDPR